MKKPFIEKYEANKKKYQILIMNQKKNLKNKILIKEQKKKVKKKLIKPKLKKSKKKIILILAIVNSLYSNI